MTNPKPYLLLTITAALWGFAFVAQRVGAGHVGPWTFNAVRFTLGATSLLPLIYWRTKAGIQGDWRIALTPGIIAGACLYLAATLQQAGLAWTTAGNAAFITSLYIVIVPLLGIFLGRPATRFAWIGIGLAIPGLFLLTVGKDFTVSFGDSFQLLGALFWASHIMLIARYSTRVEVLRLAVVQFYTCAVLSFVSAHLFEAQPLTGLSNALWPILYGGLLSVGVAYTLQVVAQKDADPTLAAMIMSGEAVFGALGGAVILGERLSAQGLIGCVLMLGGVLVSQIPAKPAVQKT